MAPQARPSGDVYRRPPRVADTVADELRERILATPDGTLLPKHDELLAEFNVSLPSVREALRILETEGLLTVVRGNTGGAVVRLPTAAKVAYTAALALQARDVELNDIAGALQHLEPVCSRLAAGRDDRETAVLPVLRARNEASRAALDDADAFVHTARLFHEDLVSVCGNETMILFVGALESLWSTHVDTLARETAQLGPFAELGVRKRSLDEHMKLVDAIEWGDGDRAEQLARAHFTQPDRHVFMASARTVQASLLRNQ